MYKRQGPARAYAHLAIRPFDLTYMARNRVIRKVDQFRRGFIEDGGVSGQYRAILPPDELKGVMTCNDFEAIARQLETLAGGVRSAKCIFRRAA